MKTKSIYGDKRLEKQQLGYFANYHKSKTAGAFEYEMRDPQGGHVLHGAFTGTEQELQKMLLKAIRRNNGLFGVGAGWSWRKTADAAGERRAGTFIV